MKIRTVIGFFGLLILLACSPDEGPEADLNTEHSGGQWLVPFEDILYWGDPADEIISIDEPEFIKVSESDWKPEDRMLVQYHKSQVRVYPIIILEEHEIVNDRIDTYYFAISYCPITGSGMSWDRNIDDKVTEFGVSGMLYRDNLVPYDRNTKSYWSQMRMLCINGELIESEAEAGLVFETDFELLGTHFPNANILLDKNSWPVSSRQAYIPHKDSYDDIEPGNGSSGGTLNPGEYYYGVIWNDRVMIFAMEMFANGITVYTTSFFGKQLVVAGSKGKNFIVSYEITGTLGKNMTSIPDQFPVVMKDIQGNVYDVFGKVVSGPDEGTHLIATKAYRAKGFAWEDIFNTMDIFEDK